MPNGTRTSYRVRLERPPSPAHSSDSDLTTENKRRWWTERALCKVRNLRLLPPELGFAIERVASYIDYSTDEIVGGLRVASVRGRRQLRVAV